MMGLKYGWRLRWCNSENMLIMSDSIRLVIADWIVDG